MCESGFREFLYMDLWYSSIVSGKIIYDFDTWWCVQSACFLAMLHDFPIPLQKILDFSIPLQNWVFAEVFFFWQSFWKSRIPIIWCLCCRSLTVYSLRSSSFLTSLSKHPNSTKMILTQKSFEWWFRDFYRNVNIIENRCSESLW